MKYIKTYEGIDMNHYNDMVSRFRSNGIREEEIKLSNEDLKKELNNFYNEHDIFVKNDKTHLDWHILRLMKIPGVLYDEYSQLHFYYSTYNVNKKNKQILNFVKNNIKREVTKEIIKKLNDIPEEYDKLYSAIEERLDWNGKISGMPDVKYTLMVFMKAMEKTDRYLMEQDAKKYNI